MATGRLASSTPACASPARSWSAIGLTRRSRTASAPGCARLELGMRAFLEAGGFKGFTTTFEDLHGLRQLPGLAPQRLMAEGYGFAGEGDWKTAALDRLLKVMSHNQSTGFMEDYTYE